MMRKLLFVFAAAAAVRGCALAAAPDTVWTARHRHEVNTRLEFASSCLDNQGRLFFCGIVYDPPYTDIYALKVDPKTNDTLWCGSFRTAPVQLTWASDCVCDSAGDLFVVGTTTPVTKMDMLVVKFNGATGTAEWDITLNSTGDTSSYATACDVDKFGFLYVAGTKSFAQRQSMELIKIDPSTGDKVWSSTIDDVDNMMNEPVGCLADSSGNIFVIADNDSALYYRLGFRVSKHNAATGETLWTRRHGWEMGPGGAVLDLGGSIYVSGSSSGLGSRIIKLSADNGDVIWNSFVADSRLAHYLNRTRGDINRDSDYIFSTTTEYTSTWLNLIKLKHATGDTVWLRKYVIDPLYPNIENCLVAPDDTVIVAMKSRRSTYYPDPWTFDYSHVCIHAIFSSDTGDKIRMHAYEIRRDYQEQGLACLADRSGNLYQVGYFDGAKCMIKAGSNDGIADWEMRYFYHNFWHQIVDTKWSGGSCIDAAGRVFVTGEMNYGLGDFTARINPATGDTVWANKHNDGRADVCCVDDSGKLYAIGQGASFIKYEALTGTRIAQQTNSLSNTTLYDCVVSQGCVFAVGSRNSNSYILKNRTSGVLDSVWTRSYPFCQKIYGCAVVPDGGIFVCGTAGDDYLLAKVDTADGDTVWTRSYDGPAHGTDIAYDCVADTNGNIYVTGASGNGVNTDYVTVCYTPSGDTLWTRRYDGPDHGNDLARGITIDSLGYLYVTGSSQNTCNYDIVTVKYGNVYAGIAGDNHGAIAPAPFALRNNFPNPFRTLTIISYQLPAMVHASLRIYNIAGQCVRTLINGTQGPGEHRVTWNGADDGGARLSAGIYFYRLSVPGKNAVGKLTLMR